MSTKMLINATRGGQLRVAIVEGTILQEFQVEVTEDDQTRGNIYRGVVANIQPSLNAAFVDLGEERHGFLPAGDVLPCAYHSKPPKDVRRPNISQVLEKGKPILVQVTKDGVGQKGPALSTNLALAGRYLVLTPYDAVRGISRKAQDDAARKKIRERLKKLELPDEHGVIVRTNGLDQNQQTLSRDLNALLRLWKKVKTEANRGRGAKLVYSDQDLVMQALRDYLDASISEVVVDHDEVFAKAEAFMKAFMPRSKTQLVRYEDRLPLFSRYRLETQIDRIYERTASLPSGGGIVIDQTEALTAIDVNSGRATKTTNHDESIYKINCEAAKEVGRQLRLRDIGGLVVVDFIDMRLRKHQNRLERVMRDSMKRDNARHSVGRISPNGLLEINRQRIKQSLRLRTHRSCPTCEGAGTTPTPEFAALRLLSRIEARAASGMVQSVTLALHPEIADNVQNRYRSHLTSIEEDHGVVIEILAASNLGLTEERVEWVQREGGASALPAVKTRRAVNAADLTPPDRRDGAAEVEAEEEETKDSDGSREGKSSGRRRRRRRRRSRRGGQRDGEQTGTEQSETEQAAEAAAGGDDKARESEVRSARAESAAAREARAAARAESEAEKGEESGEASSEGEAPKGRVRRRRRRRGRRSEKSTEAAAMASESDRAEADSEARDPFVPPAEAVQEAGSESGVDPGDEVQDVSQASPDEAVEASEDAPVKKVHRRRRRRPRSRRSAAAAEGESQSQATGEEVEAPTEALAADGQETEEFDQRQPESNASALHELREARDPFVEALAQEAPSPTTERPVSQRLRWQWWGGDEEEETKAPVVAEAAPEVEADGDVAEVAAAEEAPAEDVVAEEAAAEITEQEAAEEAEVEAAAEVDLGEAEEIVAEEVESEVEEAVAEEAIAEEAVAEESEAVEEAVAEEAGAESEVELAEAAEEAVAEEADAPEAEEAEPVESVAEEAAPEEASVAEDMAEEAPEESVTVHSETPESENGGQPASSLPLPEAAMAEVPDLVGAEASDEGVGEEFPVEEVAAEEGSVKDATEIV